MKSVFVPIPHRDTDRVILDNFGLLSNNVGGADVAKYRETGLSSARVLEQERFFVDNMWPVSCQCCGVIQKKSG